LIVQVHFYSGGLTGHIAWQFGNAYASFNKGEKVADAGSVELPLPGGTRRGRAIVSLPDFRKETSDLAEYVDEINPRVTIRVTACNEALAGLFAKDLITTRLPYVLWNPTDFGSINCVTTSIMIFAVMLPPEPWPVAWDAKWGNVFRSIASMRWEAAGKDWIDRITHEPFPQLMYVDQFKEMVEDWQHEQPHP